MRGFPAELVVSAERRRVYTGEGRVLAAQCGWTRDPSPSAITSTQAGNMSYTIAGMLKKETGGSACMHQSACDCSECNMLHLRAYGANRHKHVKGCITSPIHAILSAIGH